MGIFLNVTDSGLLLLFPIRLVKVFLCSLISHFCSIDSFICRVAQTKAPCGVTNVSIFNKQCSLRGEKEGSFKDLRSKLTLNLQIKENL